MSQTEKKGPAQNLNNPFTITFFKCGNGTICIVSIVSSDGKTQVFGNGIGKIVPVNRITKKGDVLTPEENRKQYTLHLENGNWNVSLDGICVHTFNEIFGLPAEITHLENVSFRQFKYVPTADDETTTEFTQLLGQHVSAYPDRFCLKDPAEQMEIRDGGIKVRIPQPNFDLIKQLLIRFGVSTCSFVEHLFNGSENGVCRGDADLYVLDAKQAELIIEILTELGFVKDSTDKSNDNTFRIYLDVLCQKFSGEAIMPNFDLTEGSVPANYYIELEIKIATEFQKAYESNCSGFFLGLLLSHYFKITNSGIWLKHGCCDIRINVDSFDDFLKKLGINLDGIRTTHEFIEQLLTSPLISELMNVDDILRLYKNIMGDEKTKHTSKPLRQWLHLLICGLKERFPDQFSSLRSKLEEKMFQDEKSGQTIPVWRVLLFVSNQGSEFEIQMEKGVLFIKRSEKNLFISTGYDKNSLIFSEKEMKSDSGEKPIPESMKVCSRIFKLLKNYFDYLKEINTPRPVIELFIDALRCRSEVGSHLGEVGSELMKKIRDELMKPLYPVIETMPASMTGILYGVVMKNLKHAVIDFPHFEKFCVKMHGLRGDYNDFVIRMMNHEIFSEYFSSITKAALLLELSHEEDNQMRGEIYDDSIRNIEKLCLELVSLWSIFHNSTVYWEEKRNQDFHIPSNTYHEKTSDWRLYYLGTSVLGEASFDSLPSKGKKQKGKQQSKQVLEERPHEKPDLEEKPQANPVLEEKPQEKPDLEEKPQANPDLEEKLQGKPVHVFMDGQTGVVFTMPIAE
jgi:hypothetical protein